MKPCLSLLLSISLASLAVASIYGKNQDDSGIDFYLRHIGKKTSSITERLQHTLHLDSGVFLKRRHLYQNEECDECVELVDIFKTVIDLGFEFEDLRELAIDICADTVSDEGWRTSEVCTGIIDLYGPHVVLIVQISSLAAQDICLKWNLCAPEDLPRPGAKSHTSNPPPQTTPPKQLHPNRQMDLTSAIKLLHLTDIHVEEDYVEGAPTVCDLPVCCLADANGNGTAGYYGEYDCNIPVRTLDLFLDFFKDKDIDLIAYTGDSAPHQTWRETQEGQLAATRLIGQKLAQFGLPVYPNAGNHETFPTNLYYITRPEIQEFNAVYGETFRDLAGFQQEQLDSINAGGYYSIMARPGLRVISYNTNYGATDNFYNLLNEYGEDYLAMESFMMTELQNARSSGDKVLLLGHHPPGGSGMHLYFDRFMTEILSEFNDVITLHLLGHGHSDRIRTHVDESGEVKSVLFSSPSLTSRTDINPSARIFYLDPFTFAPLDQDTFYIDLKEATADGAEIKLSYRATEEYNMSDLSPVSFTDFINRMERDEELLRTFRYNEGTRVREAGTCDDVCRQTFFCRIKNTNYQNYRACVNAQ